MITGNNIYNLKQNDFNEINYLIGSVNSIKERADRGKFENDTLNILNKLDEKIQNAVSKYVMCKNPIIEDLLSVQGNIPKIKIKINEISNIGFKKNQSSDFNIFLKNLQIKFDEGNQKNQSAGIFDPIRKLTSSVISICKECSEGKVNDDQIKTLNILREQSKFFIEKSFKMWERLPIYKSLEYTNNQIPKVIELIENFLKNPETDVIPSNNTRIQEIETIAQPIIVPQLPLTRNIGEKSVKDLMEHFTKAWDCNTKSFKFTENSFNLESFTKHLSNHANHFKKENVNNTDHFGYIEKFDLTSATKPRIYMRADLHGDLKSLIENVRSLQKEGLLDDNFKCRPGVHLIFLGDYCDRGIYGTEILEMLMCLREENPEQVHLIRGNHEYFSTNRFYCGNDTNLIATLANKEAQAALERFYETMALTTYISVNEGKSREYVQCTHGLFEATMDPASLLDQKTNSGTHLPVPKTRKLSDRIKNIADGTSKLSEAAKRVDTLVKNSFLEHDMTAYNWADVTTSEISTTWGLGNRQYALSSRDIRHYLDLSSEQHRVEMIFRGHQHAFQHLKYNNKVLVTTLPVGMDSLGYKDRFDQLDRAYIINPKAEVKDWTKRAILRESGETSTKEITGEFPLTSDQI